MKQEAMLMKFIDNETVIKALRKPFQLDRLSCFSDMSKFIFFEGECLWSGAELPDCPGDLKDSISAVIEQIKASKFVDIKIWDEFNIVNGVKLAASNVKLLKEMGVKEVWNNGDGTLFFKKGFFMGGIKEVLRIERN